MHLFYVEKKVFTILDTKLFTATCGFKMTFLTFQKIQTNPRLLIVMITDGWERAQHRHVFSKANILGLCLSLFSGQ